MGCRGCGMDINPNRRHHVADCNEITGLKARVAAARDCLEMGMLGAASAHIERDESATVPIVQAASRALEILKGTA